MRALPLVCDVFPTFADDPTTALASQSAELAAQMDGLRLVGRCRYGQSDCATFHVRSARTAPRALGYGPREHECVELDALDGLVVLDVEGGRLTSVEVLGRPDVKRALDVVIPLHVGPRLP